MRTAGRALGREAAWGVVAVGVEKAVALGIALYLPRHLELADYGRYVLLVSYLGFFQALPDASLEAVLVTRLARAGSARVALAGRGAGVRLAVSCAGALVGLAVLALVTGEAALVGAGLVGAVGLAVLAANPYRALLRAESRLAAYVVLVGLQALVALVLLALVVRAGGGLVPVLGAVSAGAFAALVAGRALVGAGARLRPEAALARVLATAAWPLAATALALLGAQQVLQLLLLRLHGPAAVGLLGGAQRLVEAVGLLPQALMLGVLPAFARAADLPGAAAGSAREAARALLAVLVPVAIVLGLWAGPLLATVLGPRFAEAAPVLRALVPVVLLNATGTILGNLLLALGLQRVLLRVTVVSAVLLVGAGSLLVPPAGASGLASAIAIGMLVGQALLVALPRTRSDVVPALAGALRPVALGAAAAAAVWGLGGSVVAGALVLLVGYPAALVLSGTVTPSDLARWRGVERAG